MQGEFKVKQLLRYQCSDGSIFEDENIAAKHELSISMRKDMFSFTEKMLLAFIDDFVDAFDFEKYQDITPKMKNNDSKIELILNNLYPVGNEEESCSFKILAQINAYRKDKHLREIKKYYLGSSNHIIVEKNKLIRWYDGIFKSIPEYENSDIEKISNKLKDHINNTTRSWLTERLQEIT